MGKIKQTKDKKQTIVTVANDSYIGFLSVLLISLKINFQSAFEIFILNDGLTEETKSNLKNISDGKFELTFIYLPDLTNKFLFSNQITDPHFWRLIAPHIFHYKDKILYLDADTMVRKSILDLFSMFGENKTASACIDYLEKIETGISNWKDFNLNPNKGYFNSGVLLIDTKRFIEMKIAEQIIEVTKSNFRFTKACAKWEQYDQYGFNIVLYNDWYELSNTYNYGSELEFKDAAIVHFNGNGKPNSNSCNVRYKDEFYYYLNEASKFKNKSIAS